MSRKPPQVASPQLIAVWVERSNHLASLLYADPGGEWAWLWRVRLEILNFLLKRYSPGAPKVGAGVGSAADTAPAAQKVETTAEYEKIAPGVETGVEAERPPQAQTAFTERLARLRELNEEVRKEYPPPPPQVPRITRVAVSPLEQASSLREAALKGSALSPEEYWLLMVRLQEIRRSIDDLHLTDEQRIAIRKIFDDAKAKLEQNQAFYRTVNLSYPEEGFSLGDEKVRDEERWILEAEFEAIRDVIATAEHRAGGAALSEDDIVAILCGVGAS